jgi:hypothetical protein
MELVRKSGGFAWPGCEIVVMKATAKNIVHRSPTISLPASMRIDWTQATADLDAQGCAVLKGLLTPEECDALATLYPDDQNFRSRIVMGPSRLRPRRVQVFRLSAADLIAELRPTLYARLHPVANRWNETMGSTSAIPTATRHS